MQTSGPSRGTLARTMQERLKEHLEPLLARLDEQLDLRLVRTFAACVEIRLQNRYRASGLLLSELGAFLTSPGHAPAGTKRLSNLLRSKKWSAGVIAEFLWEKADHFVRDLVCRQREPLAIWGRERVGEAGVDRAGRARLRALDPGEAAEAHPLYPFSVSMRRILFRMPEVLQTLRHLAVLDFTCHLMLCA
jgi:hypothetical protein